MLRRVSAEYLHAAVRESEARPCDFVLRHTDPSLRSWVSADDGACHALEATDHAADSTHLPLFAHQDVPTFPVTMHNIRSFSARLGTKKVFELSRNSLCAHFRHRSGSGRSAFTRLSVSLAPVRCWVASIHAARETAGRPAALTRPISRKHIRSYVRGNFSTCPAYCSSQR